MCQKKCTYGYDYVDHISSDYNDISIHSMNKYNINENIFSYFHQILLSKHSNKH